MAGIATMGRAVRKNMNWVDFARKIVVCSKSVIFWQRRRPRLPGKRDLYHHNLQIRESKSGRVSNQNHVSGAGRLHQWVLCMDFALTFSERSSRSAFAGID